MPTIKAVSSSQRRRPVSAAFSTVQAPRSSTRVRVLSIVTLRLVRILMGLSARASADSKVASDQVVEEPNGQHASQCLGQEDADRVEAKDFGAGRLQPEAYWGLVDRDKATWIIGDKKEIMPTIQHTSDGSRIIGPEAVLAQRIEVHDD